DLRPSLTFNKSLHDRPRYDLDDQKIRQLREFSHSLDPKQPLVTAKGLKAATTRVRHIEVATSDEVAIFRLV
ncbi:hypothetical protein, partial [Pseudomonas koreensis]|uniref:hypothetical protein n=1 Tax=Pseudomonas koreensis TaxID=198620 RepID=UPI00320AE6C1